MGVPLVLTAAGFGNGGIAGGSAAAAWQATSGSAFATLQSIGAAGLSASTVDDFIWYRKNEIIFHKVQY